MDETLTEDLAALRSRAGGRVRQRRRERGWSQTELARQAGVGLMTISRLERGTHDPPLSLLGKVAAALSLSVAGLVE